MKKDTPIIVALDFAERQSVFDLVSRLDPQYCRLKVGSILFTRYGPALVTELMQRGFDIFLDLKFHDIPHTVVGACRAAVELGVWMLTLHTSGGLAMLQAACEAVAKTASLNHLAIKPLTMGVTILTSLETKDLASLEIHESVSTLVTRLARQAVGAGLDGIVCSPHEVSVLRQQLPKETLILTPGIRATHDPHADQKRVMTASMALVAGADYLVIGRPITTAADPVAALFSFYEECQKAQYGLNSQ